MQKRHLLCILFLARCVSAQDAPPVDAATLLTSLKDLAIKQAQAAKTQDGKMIQELSAAGASNSSAIAFYEQAIQATSFAGQNREQTQFRDWKKKHEDELKGTSMQTAVRWHLNYLVLSLQRAKGATIRQLLPALMTFANQVGTADKDISTQDVLKKKLSESIFVKWYGTGKLLGGVKDWEPIPGNADGIWQTTILPQLRLDKDVRAIQYWDDKLQLEAKAASDSGLEFNTDQFNFVRKPELLWLRAQDMLEIGQRNRALNEMFNVVKNWPNHASNAEWIAKLKELLSGTDVKAPEASPQVK